jgi:hypothetical protein
MAQRFPALESRHIEFIAAQKMFFVATAAPGGRINLSPKGMTSFRVLDPGRVAWLNVTGSGNETAAHVRETPRMTLMFCAFEGDPLILRLYGTARVVHRHDGEWPALAAHFPDLPGARQIFEVALDLVQTSCGAGVPRYDYIGDRTTLSEWAAKKGEDGLRQYWHDKNRISLDGLPTHIFGEDG